MVKENCMLRLHLALSRVLFTGAALLFAGTNCFGQETRGSITGKVTDPQDAVVPGATVVVTNTATGIANRLTTNQTGYYEANFLIPGPYSVEAAASGFKKTVRSNIELSTGDRLAIDVLLEIGESTVAVEVSAAAPLLETTNAVGGRVLDTRDIANLPVTTMNPWALQAITPGAVFTGAPGINRVMDHAGTASYDIMGLGSGTNEFLLDGAPVTGTNGGRAGFVPSAEAVDEVRIETNAFDAAMGHSVGAFISGTTKSGANAIHGSAFAQYMWYRINSTNEFTRASYLASQAAGTLAAGTHENPGGRFFQPGFSFGGPVYIPKVINGKNKLFFYIEYDHITSIQPSPGNVYYNVPTAAQRQGNFSDLSAYNAVAYTIYDPRTAVLASNGHVTRTPFPNNTIPTSLFSNNAFYKFFQQLYPLPNVTPSTPDGFNYFDPAQPYNDYLPSLVNRYDYNITNSQHLSGKWYYNHRFSDNYDWAHDTPLKGYESNGLWRPTRGGNLDYTNSFNARNVLDVTFSITQYAEGDKQPIKNAYKASDAGLPTYIDAQAGGANGLPGFLIGTSSATASATPGIYANIASTSYEGYSGPGVNQRGTTEQLAVKMATILNKHTLKYGWEDRRYHYATFLSGACTTGCYTFGNGFFTSADNTTTGGQLGLSWASFMTGMPTAAKIDSNDTGYYSTPYHALYIQDDFRVTDRLRLGFGLRFEREGGTSERFNRGLSGAYDPSFTPPYAQAVQAAYTTGGNSLLPSSITVAGGPSYLGQPYSNLTSGTNRFLPNFSAVYSYDSKTVIRFGTGMFADTFNSEGGTGNRELQNGYSQSTSTTMTTDNGLTFCCGIGAAANVGSASIISNPFPVLPSGARFLPPVGNAYGANILDGQGFTYYPRDFSPTWTQRWRLSVQREIFPNQVIDVSYNGAYASSPATKNLSYLPAQYWNFFDSLNSSVDNAMKATVANPFLYTNFSSMATSNPALYNYLSSLSWFTGKTLQVQQLLRANLNAGAGLSEYGGFRAKTMYNDMELLYTKRFSKGIQSSFMYTRVWSRNQWQENQFDQSMEWEPNPNSRPNRFVWTTVWELPFGKGHQWVQHGPMQQVLGGWQLSWIYQYQTGPLISFGNVFYYGSLDQLVTALNHSQIHDKYIHYWFDPAADYNNLINSSASATGAIPSGFVGFEGRSAFQPGTYQARLMPQYVDGLRADSINNWDIRIQRKFYLYERLNASFAVDLLNAANRVQYAAPTVTPSSTSFGQVTSQANGPRQIQFNLRVEF
jgi:hypothetical protein